MKSLLLAASIFLCFGHLSEAQIRDLYSDTWAAADALGRTLPGYEQAGPSRENKTVGIFCWTWHTFSANNTGPSVHDNTKIIAANPDNPSFGPVGASHHWGKPELGYYISTDP